MQKRLAFKTICGVIGIALSAGLSPATATAETTVSTLIIADQGVPLESITEVGIGLRRGVRSVDGVRYVYQGELLAQREVPVEIFDAIEQLPALEEEVRTGSSRSTREQVQAIIDVFEANLDLVSKANLATAYLLEALTWCGNRRGQTRCRQGFAYVLRFRDTFVYDPERFPPEYQELFEETRAALLADGARGSVRIETIPSGAEVFVDGRSIGASPALLNSALSGEHYVTVKADGYHERVVRVSVPVGDTSVEEIALEESEASLLIQQNAPRIRRELGRPQGGTAIRAIDGYLPVNQVLIGVLSETPRGRALSVYLYDLRTNFLLSQRDASLGERGLVAQRMERLTRELYDGVSLDGRVAAPPDPEVEDDGEIWEQWWFWTAVGVAAASGTVTAIVLAPGDPEVPEGSVRLRGTIR